ncbi:MAG TPA: 2-phospho-L-lactate guanylyltransferase [Burkholderiales bacterium]|nr:2-phospho-L-lactate guanylyltransferase [Burkholderiales bacterium]
MSLWLVVPVKSLREGKSRLASALEPGRRAALVEQLLVHTLDQAAQFPGLQRTLVVSACEQARGLARACGARALKERAPGGLNDGLRQAHAVLAELGATRMLMVASDLPLLSADDLEQLAAAASASMVALAPDRSGQGTNGLCVPLAAPFEFAFGANSFTRHVSCVQRLGMGSVIVERAGLAFDVDLPEDLSALHALEMPPAS